MKHVACHEVRSDPGFPRQRTRGPKRFARKIEPRDLGPHARERQRVETEMALQMKYLLPAHVADSLAHDGIEDDLAPPERRGLVEIRLDMANRKLVPEGTVDVDMIAHAPNAQAMKVDFMRSPFDGENAATLPRSAKGC